MAAANSAPPSAIDAAADAALAAVGLAPGGGPVGTPAAGSTPGGSEQLPLGLRNKQPHWNDSEPRPQCLPVSYRERSRVVLQWPRAILCSCCVPRMGAFLGCPHPCIPA